MEDLSNVFNKKFANFSSIVKTLIMESNHDWNSFTSFRILLN